MQDSIIDHFFMKMSRHTSEVEARIYQRDHGEFQSFQKVGFMEELPVLGIDVSKSKVDIFAKFKSVIRRVFPNTQAGFEELQQLLNNLKVGRVHVCMESTGRYWQGLAEFLHNADYVVTVVPPARIKAHGRAAGQRTKTDRADAQTIASYCEKHRPLAWKPPSA